MIAFDVFLVTGAVVLLCLAHWRAGVLAILVMGFALDPMRKLVAGEPLYFSVLVFVLVAATMVGMRIRGVRLSLKPILAWNPTLRVPLLLFVLLIVFQSVAAYLRTRSAPIAVIGLVAYLAPIPGVLVGYSYARTTADVKKVVTWYVVGVAIMTTGIYLSRAGYEWKVLESVGVGLVAYTPTGEQLELASGFFRTPEVAAWHVAMATCFVIMLFLSRRKIVAYILPTIVGLLYFVVALMFTGRRKGIVEVAVFIFAYLMLIAYFRRRSMRTALVLAAATMASIGIVMVAEVGATLDLTGYFERGTNIGVTEADRYRRMSFGALKFVIQRNGWLGAGAGTASQGAQYFGGGSRLVGRASEGGFGKVVAELGVPGLVLLFALGIAVGHHLWKVAREAGRGGQRRAHYGYGMIAFLFANAVMFAVAHQVFGDPLVLYVIGLALGIAFAIPHMREGSRPRVPKEQPLRATLHAGPPR
ncbi:MAG TPA: hypothetical protein VFS53_06420 [Gemmatimonadota bacterium]|nr:hypothetical protein [Gemmatimonadota bacterium]